MKNVLFYPRYIPDSHLLRLLLLYYDQVRTIVPQEDIESILNRGDMTELNSGGTKYFEPLPIRPNWGDSLENNETITKISELCTRIESDANLPPKKITLGQARKLKTQRWVYLSEAKIGSRIFDELLQRRIAVRINNKAKEQLSDFSMYSERPVLTHPRIAEFVTAQLAASVTSEHADSLGGCVTDEPHLFGVNAIPISENEDVASQIVAEALQIVVPDGLDRLHIDDYLALREKFRDHRNLFQGIVSKRVGAMRDMDELGDYLQRVREDVKGLADTANAYRQFLAEKHSMDLKTGFIRGFITLVTAGAANEVSGLGPALGVAATSLALHPVITRALNVRSPSDETPQPIRVLVDIHADTSHRPENLVDLLYR